MHILFEINAGENCMFYERYLELCEKVRLSPSAAATNAGFNRGTVSVWKKKHEAGVDVRPEKDVIEKICKFFGCSETWLLGIDEQKEKPTVKDDGLNENQRKLMQFVQSVPDDKAEMILRVIRSIVGDS